MARQLVRALLSRGAGLPGLRPVLGLPEGRHVQQLRRPTLFADFTPEETLQLIYRIQHYPSEKPLDRIAREGLSADYVRRETARAVAGAPPGLKIWPGIEIDIPTGPGEKKTQPDDVYEAVKASFAAGAHGIILSRKYSEMKLDSLRAAGRAVRELKRA
jgi:hypothetical protein